MFPSMFPSKFSSMFPSNFPSKFSSILPGATLQQQPNSQQPACGRPRTVFAALALPMMVALTLMGSSLVSSGALAQSGPLPPGTAAPAFKTTDLAGKALDLKALRGKVLLINFWATWCGPCRAAIPMLESMHKKYGNKGLVVIGVSVDDASTKNQVPAFKKAANITYTLSANPETNQKMATKYRVEGIPALFLIDQKGVVRWSQSGYAPGEDQYISQMIGNLLNSKTSATNKTARR